MKYILYLLTLTILLACQNTENARKLELAEDLIDSRPDSALNILKSINAGFLNGEKQKAYFALLYTQTLHKKYIPIKNDSLINIAVEYYKDNQNTKNKTKAFMYKGAALKDLGLYESAIEWYKKAEETCDTNDYMTLGTLNFWMADLYQRTFVANDAHIQKYKNALKYYRLIDHKQYSIFTLSRIGQLYRVDKIDSAYYYLKQAIELSDKLNDSLAMFHNMSLLAYTYYLDQKYHKAKEIALTIIENSNNVVVPKATYNCISRAYAKLNNTDSAKYYANKLVEMTLNKEDSIGYLTTLEIITITENNYKKAYELLKKTTQMSSQVLDAGHKKDLFATEKQFNNQVIIAKAEHYKDLLDKRNYLIIITLLSVLIGVILGVQVWKRKKRIVNEQALFIQQLQTDFEFQQNALTFNLYKISELNKTLNQKQNLENKLKNIINERVRLMKELMNIKYLFATKPDKFVANFNKVALLNREFKQASDAVIDIANALNGNVINYLRDSDYNLTDRDLLLLSLLCLRFSTAEVCVFMGYSNYNSANVSRCNLLKKLDITSSLDEFIDSKKGLS